MTTSPPDPSTPQLSNQGQVLLSERAASIGWYFIESYYDFYNKNIESIYKLYHSNGSLCHASFSNKVKEAKTLHKASGIESIKKRFQNDQSLKENSNRIVVTSADIQVCLKDKILIVVFGEWSKNGSPFRQFTQTFLLCPGKNENTFDLANDNLRFIDFEVQDEPVVKHEIADASELTETSKEVSSTPVATSGESTTTEKLKEEAAKTTGAKAEAAPMVNGEHKPEILEEEVTEKPSPVKTKSESKKEESMQDETKHEPKPESKTETDHKNENNESRTTQEPESEPDSKLELVGESKSESDFASKNESKSDEASQSTQNQPISWAALAAQQVSPSLKGASILSPAKTTATLATKKSPPMAHTQQAQTQAQAQTQTQTHAHTHAQTQTPTQPQPQQPQPQQPQPQQPQPQPQPTSNGKYKKEDWFPIYIRGVKDIDEDHLKNHLTRSFGEIKFFRVFVNIALCDFVDGEAQKKALAAKETEIDGYVIQLEVRESKTHNGNKTNVKNQKDKNPSGASNEKRGRNDKKQQLGKKNRSSSRN